MSSDHRTQEELRVLTHCQTILRAGIWLLQNGFGRMQLLPYVAPSGCYWRCEFHTPRPRPLAIYRYTTGSGAKYLENHDNGAVRSTISPKSLAIKIMSSVPEAAKTRCQGELSPDVAAWIELLVHVLE